MHAKHEIIVNDVLADIIIFLWSKALEKRSRIIKTSYASNAYIKLLLLKEIQS